MNVDWSNVFVVCVILALMITMWIGAGLYGIITLIHILINLF